MQYLKINLMVVFLLTNICGGVAFGNKLSPQVRESLTKILETRILPDNALSRYVRVVNLTSRDVEFITGIVAGKIPTEGQFHILLASPAFKGEDFLLDDMRMSYRIALLELATHREQKIRELIDEGLEEEETSARDFIVSNYPSFAEYLTTLMAVRGFTAQKLTKKLNARIRKTRAEYRNWIGYHYVTTEEVNGWLSGSEVHPPSATTTLNLRDYFSEIIEADRMIMGLSFYVSWERKNPGDISDFEWKVWRERLDNGKYWVDGR